MPRAVPPLVLYLSLLALSWIAGSASAQPWPAAIRAIEAKGVTIVKQFDAPGGMTGFVARAGNRPITLYLSPDGQHVVVGPMFDSDGNNVSRSERESAAVKPNRSDAWARLAQAHWIGDGDDDAPRKIYVFTDPNCPYCHKFYETARPWVNAGKVQLRHITVGILKPTSSGKAAALLAADDPEKAMNRHERNYRSGGIEPMQDVPPNIRQQVTANNRLMSDLGIQGTPGIFYRDDSGAIQVRQGLPQGAALGAVMGSK